MSQIYYCTIFSSTKMTLGKVNCRRIVFSMVFQDQNPLFLLKAWVQHSQYREPLQWGFALDGRNILINIEAK